MAVMHTTREGAEKECKVLNRRMREAWGAKRDVYKVVTRYAVVKRK